MNQEFKHRFKKLLTSFSLFKALLSSQNFHYFLFSLVSTVSFSFFPGKTDLLILVKMESQNNNKLSDSVDGVGSKGIAGMSRTARNCDLALRVLALLLTLTAAIVLGVNKQTKIVSIQVTPALPPVGVAVQAKWRYLSAFVYSVVSNIIACLYAAISTLIVSGTRTGKTGLAGQIIVVLDLVMVGLLFSAEGAALAIGLLGYNGNSHVRWNKVCNVFDKFCHKVAASIVLSLGGSLAFMALVALAVLTIHKRYATRN